MSDPLITVVFLTYRPGGFDILARSLARQPRDQYRLVVVDDWPKRDRGKVASYLSGKGIPLEKYTVSKTKSRPETALGLANAMNTGALWCRTPWLIYLHDFTHLPEEAVPTWYHAISEHGQKCLISGWAQMYSAYPPEGEDSIDTWPGTGSIESNLTSRDGDWIPERLENFYLGVPLEFMDLIGGIDERADDFIAWPLSSMTVQALLHDYRMVVDRRLACGMINHRPWGERPGGDVGLWHAARARDDPGNEPGWPRVSPNPYSFWEERERLRQEKPPQ